MSDEQKLFDAYRHTDFCADTPLGRIIVQVGHTNSTLDALLCQSGHATWAYLTAFNPASVLQSEADNEARQRDLELAAGQLSLPIYRGEGIARDASWPPERSILVVGIGRQEAVELGARFGQRAIVWGGLGGAADLVSCEL